MNRQKDRPTWRCVILMENKKIHVIFPRLEESEGNTQQRRRALQSKLVSPKFSLSSFFFFKREGLYFLPATSLIFPSAKCWHQWRWPFHLLYLWLNLYQSQWQQRVHTWCASKHQKFPVQQTTDSSFCLACKPWHQPGWEGRNGTLAAVMNRREE